jgi:hypothetical protein
LMIKINEQNTPVSFPIETNFQWIGCDCDSCDQKEGDDYCANLRKDTTYVFKITKDYTNFTGYVDENDEIHPGEPNSSKPCQPCVDYDEACGDIDSLKVPCCFGLECKSYPTDLREVNWLGKTIDDSDKSWGDKICLNSLGEECDDYTNCSIYNISACHGTPSLCNIYWGDETRCKFCGCTWTGLNCIGTPTKSYDEFSTELGCKWCGYDWEDKGQYPCYTISDYPGNRCCSPLLSVKQTGEGTTDSPDSDCREYGGCEAYCGNTNCGYVYNSSLVRFTNMCCKPPGEECWYQNWECCAHELLIGGSDTPPTKCLEDDGDSCTYESTECHCCISENYHCTPDTADYCCGSNRCLNITNNLECGEGEECKCLP